MFTGIIEEIGEIKSVLKGTAGGRLVIKANKVTENTKIGDSIAVNGVCLTVAEFCKDGFAADVMGETMRKSNLSGIRSGSLVNLERAMAADGRFGGHIVAGHVDCEGKITDIKKEDNALWVTISADNIMRYIVEEGSVAVDGVSLTAARVGDDWFSVSLIPHTRKETTLFSKAVGDSVNLEADVIGKYVERLLTYKQVPKKGITADFLSENGFI